MKKVKIAATQMYCSEDTEKNIVNAEKIVRKAAGKGANIILIQELFESRYFPQEEDYKYLSLAKPIEENEALKRMIGLAKELDVVIPVSLYEKSGVCKFNTTVIVDAGGEILGKYRKTHIPEDPGYYEKFYFSPGDTGFKVWKTKFAKIGIGICWDQWFPEAARIMALKGADFLMYPTAIGTFAVPVEEVENQILDYDHWQNVMLGHAAANMTPVIASNRIGVEETGNTAIKFWGASFISDNRGNKIAEADIDDEEIILAEFDLAELDSYKEEVCVFRDRRTEMYKPLLTLDGEIHQ